MFFSSFSQSSQTSEPDNSPYELSTNFSSILNVPQTSGVFSQLFQLLSENILEKPFFQNILQQNIEPARPITVQEACGIVQQSDFKSSLESVLLVQESDFADYIARIHKQHEEYMRIKLTQDEGRLQCENEGIDLERMVVFCYQAVPQIYFEEKFHFNYEVLFRKQDEINVLQDQLTGYLDEVEVNLFYQINSRFDQFLNVILKLNEIRNSITNNEQTVSHLRQIFRSTKAQFLNHAQKITAKKKLIVQIENTLERLRLIQTSQKTNNGIQDFIKAAKYEQSLRLLKRAEQTYNEQLSSIDCLSGYPQKFYQVTLQLQQALTQNIIEGYVNSMQKQVTPFKALKSFLQHIPQETQEDMVNSSMMESWYDSGSSIPGNLLGQLKGDSFQEKENSGVPKLIAQGFGIVDLTSRVFRNRILEEAKNYFLGFISSLIEEFSLKVGKKVESDSKKPQLESEDLEYLEELLPNQGNVIFLRIIFFLSENFQKILKNHLNINYNAIQSLLDLYAIEARKLSKNDPTSKSTLFQKYLTVIEELHLTSAQLYKFTQEKISIVLGLSKLNAETSVRDFKELITIFTSWELFHSDQIQQYLLPTNLEMLTQEDQEMIINRSNTLLTKFSASQLLYSRQDIEKHFVLCFHKDRQKKVQKSLEDEIWLSTDIPFEYYEILYYLLNLKSTELDDSAPALTIQNQESLDESIMINSSVMFEKTQRSQSYTLQQLVNNPHFKIVKNELQLMKEGIKFKFTPAFLYFLHNVYDYLMILESIHINQDHIQKFYELLKQYNSLSTQLILGAGAIAFGKMKTIAAKNLAISSLCIRFFLQISDKIQTKLQGMLIEFQKQQAQLNDDFTRIINDYRNHNQEILNKMATLLQDRFQEQCIEISKQNWNDPQSKLTTPSRYTAQLLNSTRQMHIAVEDLFLPQDLKTVFLQIINSLKQDYITAFQEITISNKLGATRVKQELEYLRSSLMDIGKLKDTLALQFNQLDQDIEFIVFKKCTPFLNIPKNEEKQEEKNIDSIQERQIEQSPQKNNQGILSQSDQDQIQNQVEKLNSQSPVSNNEDQKINGQQEENTQRDQINKLENQFIQKIEDQQPQEKK